MCVGGWLEDKLSEADKTQGALVLPRPNFLPRLGKSHNLTELHKVGNTGLKTFRKFINGK